MRRVYLLDIRIDKQRDFPDPRVKELRNDQVEALSVRKDVQPTLRCHLFSPLGNERREVGARLAAYPDDIFIGRELEVQLALDCLLQRADITIRDVAPILAQVKHDAVCTCSLAERSRVHRIGKRLSTSVT